MLGGRQFDTTSFKEVFAASDVFAFMVDGKCRTRPKHASNTCLVPLAGGLICLVERAICKTQIVPAIIVTYSINMVYLIGWIFSGHVKKSKPVGRIAPAVKLDLKIPIPVSTRRGSNRNAKPGKYMGKDSSFGVVTKKLFESNLIHQHSIT